MNNEMKVASVWWRVRNIVADIDYIIGLLEDYEGDCCGMACSCYDNMLIDIQNCQDQLRVLGYSYRHGQLLRDDSIWHERF
jgi:hypothetical protein